MLSISRWTYWFDISHDRNLKDFLVAMSNNNKHKVVIRVKEPLIEKRSNIQNSKVETSLDVGNDFRLEEQGLEVREYHLVELLYVHHRSALSFAFSIQLPDNKHWETEWGVLRSELKTAKAMHLVKRLANKLASFVSQGVYPRLDGKHFCLPASLEWHFHPALRWYLDEALGFPNGWILGNKLS